MATPLCPYFGSCGGCTAQHIDYSLQLQNKQAALARITKGNIEVFSGKEYFYRNRMDFIFHNNGLGLREKGRWDKIVDVERCVIADERINKTLQEIRSFFKDPDFFDVKKHSGTFRYAVIRCANETSVSFVLNEKSSRLAEAVEKIKQFASISPVESILVTYVPPESDVSVSSEYFVVKGNDTLDAMYIGKTFAYPIQGFFQNNHEMAERMQQYAHDLLKKYLTADAHLLDLYAGVGTFGIVNASLFKAVTLVESVPPAIEAAKRNIQTNEVKNVKAILLDAKQIQKLSVQQPLYVITDPPRSGMDQKTIQTLNAWKPQVILYISCNPEQLAKDLPKLKNYEIKSAALFDLFPQTPHSEAVIELVRKSAEENPQ